jgi:hypothetical protein
MELEGGGEVTCMYYANQDIIQGRTDMMDAGIH